MVLERDLAYFQCLERMQLQIRLLPSPFLSVERSEKIPQKPYPCRGDVSPQGGERDPISRPGYMFNYLEAKVVDSSSLQSCRGTLVASFPENSRWLDDKDISELTSGLSFFSRGISYRYWSSCWFEHHRHVHYDDKAKNLNQWKESRKSLQCLLSR